MAIDTKHPEYIEAFDDWEKMSDCIAGQKKIKEKTTKYLKKTQRMIEQEISGKDSYKLKSGETIKNTLYDSYIFRAVFPDITSEAVEAMLGLLHRKPPTIELPEKMKFMKDSCSIDGESLEEFHRSVNEEQFSYGRLGILVDIDNGVPYFVKYKCDKIINWDNTPKTPYSKAKLNLVVIDESQYVRNGYDWNYINQYRILELVNNNYTVKVEQYDETIKEFVNIKEVLPSTKEGNIPEIPFVFCNTKNTLAKIDNPPLLGLAELCLAIYRNSADYEQNLFMQSQDTLVIKGIDESETKTGLGVGNAIYMSNPAGDAKFIGVTETGISEQRLAIENKTVEAVHKAGQLITTAQKESAEALSIRIGAQTSMLTQIAKTGAEALQKALRIAAVWLGEDPAKVTVKPNLDFIDDMLKGSDLESIVKSKIAGAPISNFSIHTLMKNKGLTILEFEEELSKIEEEEANSIGISQMSQVQDINNTKQNQNDTTGDNPGSDGATNG